MTRFRITAVLALALWLSIPACAQEAPVKNPLVLGEYALAKEAVIDGDTIRVDGLKASLRLLCLDAEETFKNASDRKAATEDFEAYRDAKEADSDLPVKYATFVGEDAKDYAHKFFDGVKTVRLEYDTLNRKIDYFNRNLCYVFATPKNSKEEKNYNVELVRAGLSPYSMKYGHSTRFRDKFEGAEKEAREAKRGIWAEKPRGYRDYDKRLKWWKERGDQIEKFEKANKENKQALVLGDDDTDEKLKANAGKEMLLFGSIIERDGFFPDEKQPRVMLGNREKHDFAVRFADKKVYEAAKPEKLKGVYVTVKGKLEYDEKYKSWFIVVTEAAAFVKA
ncbi:MAG: thermonuclease family protein [Planctomycetes bacterium]|nr:thermonuclease family protein [Planctomycetota bacterium]